MSFILPGNARSLRFTGEAKAYASGSSDAQSEEPKGGAVALGQPRVRKPSAPPPRVPAPSQFTTPSAGVVPKPRIATPAPSPAPRFSVPPPRPPAESLSDEPTRAMERDDVLPGALRTPKPTLAPHAPAIPHFRPRAAVQQPAPAPSPAPAPARISTPPPSEARSGGASYAVWVLASVIAGVISYHLAPELLVPREPPAHVQSR